MKDLPENSVDSVVTDPPYGLSFMGKKWDYDVPSVEIWQECLRVLKPGGFLLSFAGTRTQHRMAVNIEDAGFEIRDMIAWIYASGFPKSHNIGKAVDKLQGNERSVLEERKFGGRDGNSPTAGASNGGQQGGYNLKDERSITKGTSPWEGWGTALKPSHEDITVAQKPLETRSDLEYTVGICQTLLVEIAKKSSELNLNEKTQQSIALLSADENIKAEDLLEAMDMLRSGTMGNTSLNTVLSWLSVLVEIWIAQNTSTISTKLNMTTELKILQSLGWENILENITPVDDNQINGLSADVYNVESILTALKMKLDYTLEHSAEESAMFSERLKDLRPNLEPITVARKPFKGTVAENVLKHGTGGINVDGTRIKPEYNLQGSDLNGIIQLCQLNHLQLPANSAEKKRLLDDTNNVIKMLFSAVENVDMSISEKALGKMLESIYKLDTSCSEEMLLESISTSLSMSLSGNQNMERSLKDLKYITSTVSKMITDWKISSVSVCQLTGDLLMLAKKEVSTNAKQGRFPSNLIHDGSQEVMRLFPETKKGSASGYNFEKGNQDNPSRNVTNIKSGVHFADSGSAARFFYCAKASKKDRNEGCEGMEEKEAPASARSKPAEGRKNALGEPRANHHPTVKPTKLMRYLCRLVTQPGGVILDPFMGSGSTGKAAKLEGFDFIGIELDEEYLEIAEARIEHTPLWRGRCVKKL